MAETRDRTSTRPAPMREDAMPRGQAPAVQRPLTAMQVAARERAEKTQRIKDAIFEAVEIARLDIESFLSVYGVTYELFMASLTVFMSKQERDQPDFFVDMHIPSFIEALTRIAMNGLLADGKEAAIAAYKNRDLGNQRVAQPMFMRDGFVKVLWRTGMVKAINDQVVTEAEYKADRFEYEEGDQGYIRHRLDLGRKDTDPVIAAYCIIELVGGGVMREVVPKDELDKMAKMSRSPAREAWKHQMHRKGAIRRIMGKMPREKGIVQLLQHDDETYLPSPADRSAEDEGAPPRDALFSNKPIRRKRREPLPVKDGKIVSPEGGLQVQAGDVIHGTVTEDGTILDADLVRDEPEGGEPYILKAVITTKNGLQQFPPAEAEFWFGDLSQKMKTLPSGEQLDAFWKKNRPYIQEAGFNGYTEYAMKLMALAKDLGLETPRGE